MRLLNTLKCVRTSVLAASMLFAGSAAAQPGPTRPTTNTPDAGYPATWSTPELERLGTMLSGMWKTDAAVAGAEGEMRQIVLSIGPVGIANMPNAMYFEVALADSLHAPYRQAIFQLFDYKGRVRLRTYEFLTGSINKEAFIGAWAMPEAFPPLSRDEFIATLDIEGTASSTGFSGQTPYPYPTAVDGAFEMTSRLELNGNRLITEDRGYGADGAIVWGQEAGGSYTYSKVDPSTEITITRDDSNGLVVMEYREGVGREPQTGDTFAVHFTGWFTRNTTVWNTSRSGMGAPFSYVYPGQMVEGWVTGTAGMKAGSLRRFYIPYAIGYGEAGQPTGGMPARSNLVFELECVNVAAAPAPPAGVNAPVQPDGAFDVPP